MVVNVRQRRFDGAEPRLFGMGGVNSQVLVSYTFQSKSVIPELLDGSDVTADSLSTMNTAAKTTPDEVSASI